ncbi:ABC transporter permease [Aquiflexum gelatinilyticum]|uniref:ABC transporter permease n=1 Tax=Aquiflexum gelatinilyticum TaxID=2961943 RepID=A0A9X2SZ41_9BACT|nr:ABC transporter permease [Aquiflexum gelatinilyticum]MCS4436023.1 ABC transporter permease [Aquiflexum gelatinilyticum]
MIFLKLIWESVLFAMQALKSNLTRTILSLLGVTVGIFAIIAVFTLVDSLEKNIKSSFSFLGSNVVTVNRFQFVGGPDYPWWKYFRRPYSTYSEYTFLKEKLRNAEAVSFSAGANTTVQFGSNSYKGTNLTGVTYTYKDVYDVPVQKGRFFTESEINGSRNVAIIGEKVANTLFPNSEPIGKEIKIKGAKFVVIGIFELEGEGLFEIASKDEAAMIPYGSFTKLFFVGKNGIEPSIAVKGLESDIGMIALENELIGSLRAKRGLKPTEEDNFSLNKSEFIMNTLGSIFDVISGAGWVIGGFSILVGGFGIANIMFVSVKERTNIIGIQKSLGAKNYFILFQFLFEAVFLSLIGGVTGIIIVYGLTFLQLGSLELILSLKNIVLGLGISSIIGIVSGIVPATLAAKLDPVEAIRAA